MKLVRLIRFSIVFLFLTGCGTSQTNSQHISNSSNVPTSVDVAGITKADIVSFAKDDYDNLESEISELSQDTSTSKEGIATAWTKWSNGWNSHRLNNYEQAKKIKGAETIAKIFNDEFNLWIAYNNYFHGIGDKTSDQQKISNATNIVNDDIKQAQSGGPQ